MLIYKQSKSRQYNDKLFEQGCYVLIADEVREGMIIALTKCRYFYVDFIDKEFVSEAIGNLYADDDFDIAPEHTKITFIDEAGNEITDIPGYAPVIAWYRVRGNHIPDNEYL